MLTEKNYQGEKMKNKVMTAQEAVKDIRDGATIMVGGFMACGTPEVLIDALVEKNVRDLTIICNDAGLPGKGVGKLLSNGQIKKLIASHVGLNPEVAQRMNTDVSRQAGLPAHPTGNPCRKDTLRGCRNRRFFDTDRCRDYSGRGETGHKSSWKRLSS